MYYNAMKKNISRVKEALTRALNTIDAARDPANFLSSDTNYFTRRAISSPIFRECKKPLKNAAFLHARGARARVVMTLSMTHPRGSDDAQVAFDSVKNDAEKFFWITSLNRVVDDPIAIGIARIGRKAIRMRIASCEHEE